MTRRTPKQYDARLKAWAKQALHGLDESALFVGILNDHEMGTERVEFLLQLGYCIMVGKPIIITVPFGAEVPARLQSLAERIVRYDPARMESLRENLAPVLVELGISRQ